MEKMEVRPIGFIGSGEGGQTIEVCQEYIPALAGLEGFSHLMVLWWFDGCDDPASRSKLRERKPYKKGPEELGIFATRSPQRPNPLALSCAALTYIDQARGVVGLAYIDAEPGSPVLDLKPYSPCLDRVETPEVPDWCRHWPKSCEDSGDFPWEQEFNF